VAGMVSNNSLYPFTPSAHLEGNLLFYGATTPSEPGPPHCRGLTITDTPDSVGILLTNAHPDADTSTWRHTTLTRDKYDSNPQSQPGSGRSSMP